MATHRRGTSAAQWLVADLLRREGRAWPSLSPAARGLAVGGALLCSTVVAVSMAAEPQTPGRRHRPSPSPRSRPRRHPRTVRRATSRAQPRTRTPAAAQPVVADPRPPAPRLVPRLRLPAARVATDGRASRSTATPSRRRRSRRPAGTLRTMQRQATGRTAGRTAAGTGHGRPRGRRTGRRVRRPGLERRPQRRHTDRDRATSTDPTTTRTTGTGTDDDDRRPRRPGPRGPGPRGPGRRRPGPRGPGPRRDRDHDERRRRRHDGPRARRRPARRRQRRRRRARRRPRRRRRRRRRRQRRRATTTTTTATTTRQRPRRPRQRPTTTTTATAQTGTAATRRDDHGKHRDADSGGRHRADAGLTGARPARGHGRTSPSRTAQSAACVRDDSDSFASTLPRCACTVRSPIDSVRPMSRFEPALRDQDEHLPLPGRQRGDSLPRCDE